jgi:PAS domain S-box-containing protein
VSNTSSKKELERQREEDLLALSGCAIWELDANGRFQYFSDNFLENTVWRKNDALGKTPEEQGWTILTKNLSWSDVIQSDDDAKQHSLFDVQIPLGDRSSVNLKLKSKLCHQANGQSAGCRGVAFPGDIPSDPLENSPVGVADNLYFDALNSLPQGIIIYDSEKRMIYFNDSYRKIFSEIEDILVPGVTLQAIIEVVSQRYEFTNYNNYINKRMSYEKDINDNRNFHLFKGSLYLNTVEFTGSGGTISVWTDVTEMKKHTESLLESESRFSHVFKNSPVSMSISFISTGKIEAVNDIFEIASGYTRNEVIGKSASELNMWVDPDTRFKMMEIIKQKGVLRDFETKFRQKNGSIISLNCFIEILDGPGEDRVLFAAHDITNMKRYEKALKIARDEADVANRSKSEFLANMSHELRTPLNAIIGFSEIMKSQTLGKMENERYLSYAADVFNSGEHLLGIINDILDLSKVEAGAQELNTEWFDVNDLAHESTELVRGRATQADVKLFIHDADPVLKINADRLRTKQILLNLLTNAVKFSNPGTRIDLSVSHNAEKGIEFKIADQGKGIAVEEMARVMEPFGQASDPMLRNQEGTGLGLPLSKVLAELHGGTLEMQSTVGEGTVVMVKYPAFRLDGAT